MTAGRPRRVHDDELLERATRLFHAQGYEAASVSALCDATGLAAQSLYHRFGDKRGLFIACVRGYADRTVRLAEQIERQGESGVRAFIDAMAATGEHPPGCLLGTTLAGPMATDAEVRTVITKTLDRLEHAIATALAGRWGPEEAVRRALELIACVQWGGLLARGGDDRRADALRDRALRLLD
jgi:TetR/AcrR family transcriptional repressor of nem operon